MPFHPTPPEVPYLTHAAYLRARYGTRAYRVAVDAGFPCPHLGGCAYCDSGGSLAPYQDSSLDLREQISRAVSFLKRRYGAKVFLLYFQAHTATNAPPRRLREVYDTALRQAPFRELIVSTRPDCIDGPRAELLAGYHSPALDVWVELGLQSAHDSTLRFINRGHSVRRFRTAFELLRAHGIKLAVHLIFGLPGETAADIRRTVEYVAALRPEGLKIHNLHLCRGSPLGELYLRGEVTAPSAWAHLRYVAEALELLPPDTVIMRLSCDTPSSRLLGPRGFPEKQRFTWALQELMRAEGSYQGRLYRLDRH